MKIDKNIYRLAKKTDKRMVALPCKEFGAGWRDVSYIFDKITKKWAFIGMEGHTFNDLLEPAQMDVLQNAVWCNSKQEAKNTYYA